MTKAFKKKIFELRRKTSPSERKLVFFALVNFMVNQLKVD